MCGGKESPESDREARMDRDSRMMVRSDAKSVGMVTSTTTRVAPRWQGSKPGAFTSECISYKEDANGVKSEISIFRPKREHVSRKRVRSSYDRRASLIHLHTLAGNNSDAD